MLAIDTHESIVCGADPDTLECLFVSGSIRDVLGYSPDEWLHRPLFAATPARDRQRLIDACHAVAEDGKERVVEHDLVGTNHQPVHFRSELNVVGVGREKMLVGVLHERDGLPAIHGGRLFEEAERICHLGAWHWDVEQNHISWTANLFRLVGYAPNAFDVTVESYLDCVHPDDRGWVREAVMEAARRHQSLQVEHRVLFPDEKTVRRFRCIGQFLDGSNEMLGLAQDVTDDRDKRRALVETNALLHATLEATADGIIVVDGERCLKLANRRFVEMFQLPEEIARQGDRPAAIEHVKQLMRDPHRFVARLDELMRDPQAKAQDVLELADGRFIERWWEPQIVDGMPAGRVASFREVTGYVRLVGERERALDEERKARADAEEARWRSEFVADASRLLASLDYESALASVAELSVRALANWCAVDLFENGEPHRVAMASSEPLSARLLAELSQLRPHAQPPELDPLARRPEHLRRIRELGMRSYLATPLVVPGRTLGVITLVSTVEDRLYGAADVQLAQTLAERAALAVENAQLYLAAQQALSMRDEFLSVASHELNTPLTSLLLGIQSLAASPPDEPNRDRLLRRAEQQVKHLRALVAQLLDVTRLEAGELQLDLCRFDLTQLVREVSDRFRERPGGAAIRVADAPPVVGRWDKLRVDEVISSLLSNAVKYGQGKPIDVTVEPLPGTVRLSVVDRGLGIPPERTDRIFQRYGRAVSARQYGGLGLGLYMSREIVALLGGQISAASVPSGGSQFTVELPWEPA